MGPRSLLLIAAAILALAPATAGCSTPSAAPAAQEQAGSILASSRPAAGSTVAAPVNELQLHFKPPARLDEVTVAGPDGVMPTIVHAVGAVSDYSIPLSGLGPGAYTVNWRATAQGRESRGEFGFIVR